MILELKNICKTFLNPDQTYLPTLEDISFTVRTGEFVSLIGPSGCGKSSLLDIIAGLEIPDHGEVYLNGKCITGKRGNVSYMPQDDALFPWRTIIDNVIIPLELQGIPKKRAREEGLKLFPLFGLEGFSDRYPHMLSGGMRQRAALLRTYLFKKDLLLLDEPFGRLDALTRMNIQHWLLSVWQQFSKSIILVTHDIEEAILLSDRILVLSPRPGRIIAEVMVNLPRPRDSKLTTSQEFITIKSKLLEYLKPDIYLS
jgi:ABC-type nitrate/sulfonate/bicarbonate transport system ATPase subunit